MNLRIQVVDKSRIIQINDMLMRRFKVSIIRIRRHEILPGIFDV